MADVNSVSFKYLDVFESLCNKIACLVYSRTDGDKKALSQILDSLNGLDYNLFPVKKERGALLINQCCYLISPEDVFLSAKAITTFTNLLSIAHITVEGKTLSLAVSWCLECLKQGLGVNVLKCLQALVKGNGKKIDQDCPKFVKELESFTNKFTFSKDSDEICLNCLRCVEAIVCTESNSNNENRNNENLSEESVIKYFQIFKEILYKKEIVPLGTEITYCKFLITAMKGIETLIKTSNSLLNSELNCILGIVKGYMLYGLLHNENFEIQKVFPSSTTVPEVLKSSLQPVKKLRGKYDRRPKKVAVSSINAVEEMEEAGVINSYLGYSDNIGLEAQTFACRTSDSDFSDSEFSQNKKIISYESKVRLCALILLGTIVQKVDPKVFIGYMTSFLPDTSQLAYSRTLITCLLKDPSPKCRCEALGVLLRIISNSRQYFVQADSVSKSSFIAFSCTISNIIRELHNCLLQTLICEKNNLAIKRTLKCISDLIRCSPYHKMEPGLITNLAKHVKSFLLHKDVNIQIFALTVFGCIVSVEPKIPEIKNIIINSNGNVSNEHENCDIENEDFGFCDEDDTDTLQEKSWLFELCLQNLSGKNRSFDSVMNAALQIESLQVIGALVRNFFKETLVSFPNEIIDLLKNCSNRNEYSLRLFSGKLVETVLSSLQFSFSQEEEAKRAPLRLVTFCWEALLPGPVIALIQSQEEPMLRCTGCDCIANVGIQVQNGQSSSVQNSQIFDQLPRDKQIMCITLLFSCLKDDSPAVRSSASRALAILVLFPSLREDSLFFLDAVDATLTAVKDENLGVRTQASWLLGNLSEAIVQNKHGNVDDGLSLHMLAELLKTGVKLCSDIPKTKPGAVRGVGNFLQIATEEFLKKYKNLFFDGVDALIKNATTGTFMKARWNSCYAIANVLHNPLVYSNTEWTHKIFNTMTSLVQHYKNFKVRISAGFVLGIPPTRQSYGDLYYDIWSAVLNALENSKNISDFNEYQHRDQLVDQLCLVICHLMSLVERTDLNPLQDVLYFHLGNLGYFMSKFQERIVPEKSSVLLTAIGKISSLIQEKNLTLEEKGVIKALENIFFNES